MNFDVSGGLGLPSFGSQVSLGSQGSGLQSADLNSPEVFKQNIQIAQAHVARVQGLARSALAGIEHAYHHGASPVQTAEDIAAAKQALLALVEHLRQSGVGALPMAALDPPGPGPDLGARTDEQLVAEAGRAVQVLYERQKRIQDGAGVVAGLLGQGLGSGSGSGSGGQGAGMGEQLGGQGLNLGGASVRRAGGA
ncbi:hypothetical protein GSI_10062 [Ganoderma sinense ZZ0214-1]|uniref:Uncharacterized protein n=1 Tax=Ganoderma sinense ZZ0214-1 TaxID=1077348 RepID=A0A2G8RZL0_9APHY|nr:hypothetical protein GSI_10062 [Ganoderma sinense ZZ0214-1]